MVSANIVLPKCTNGNKVENIEVHLIEQVLEGNYDLEKNFGVENSIGKPKVLSHGMNSTWDWYSTNTEGYRERK